METQELEMVSFTAQDRCDGCGAQALALARKPGYIDLLFCWHHKRKHFDALLLADWEVVEDAERYEAYRTNQYQSAVH